MLDRLPDQVFLWKLKVQELRGKGHSLTHSLTHSLPTPCTHVSAAAKLVYDLVPAHAELVKA
jgi:hypothetical protein